jgi:tetratricopeptide (TPR) repeat protein
VNPATIAIVVVAAASEPSAAEDAAELFAEGEAEFAAGNYEAALEHFREADSLVPHPASKFHMARCLEALGRLHEAWALYGEVAEHTEVSPAERSAAAQRRAEIRSRLAAVRVTGPEGGEVVLDGASACVVPCTALADPGAHELEVVWPDRTERRQLELDEAQIIDLDLGVRPPPPAATPPPPAREPPEPRAPPPRWPTALTWVGIPIAGVGAIGTVAFGLRTLALRREHDMAPNEASRERGLTSRALANVSIAIAIAGGILMVADAIRYGVAKRRYRRSLP